LSFRAARALCALVAGGSLLLTASMAGAAQSRHSLRTHRDLAHAAIVGGAPISVAQAPWQVVVEAVFKTAKGSTESILCGGSIIDASHVLTAAHCVFIAPPDEQIPPSDFTVIAGTSNLKSHEAEEQRVAVAGVRVHPYYTYTPDSGHVIPDDVAVLTLEEPLALGPALSPIALAPAGVYPAEGAAVGFTGFGEQNPSTKELNGKLYSLGMNVGSSEKCGGEEGENNAVVLCASSPSGAPCSGDSGSALTTLGSPPTLLGVMNDGAVIAGKGCTAGGRDSFADVAAPEIQDFIDGSEEPPRAPRGAGAGCTAVNPTVGGSMTCTPGTWSNEPSFTYTFVNGSNGQTLQSSASSEYKFTATDAGATVFMRLQATNAGGIGRAQTAPTAPVMPAPAAETEPPPAPFGHLSLAGASIAVQSDGEAAVKLSCNGTSTCRGKLTLTVRTRDKGKQRRSKTTTIGTATFSIPPGKTETIKLKLSGAGRALLGSDHGRCSATLTILKSSPAPAQTHTESVRLVQQKAHGKTKKGS